MNILTIGPRQPPGPALHRAFGSGNFSSISECLRTWLHISNCHHYSKSQPLAAGIFFARFPIENRNDVASVAPVAAHFPARFPQIPLSLISRDASARDATSSIYKGLQAAGSISNLVGRWGIGKKLARYARIHAGCLRAFPDAPESHRSQKLLQF